MTERTEHRILRVVMESAAAEAETMAAKPSEAIRALDEKIAELERELEKLRKQTQRIPTLHASLRALRTSRALLAGKGVEPEALEIKRGDTLSVSESAVVEIGPRSGSIGAIVIGALKKSGRPMHVKELVEAVRSAGKETDLPTVVGAVARYARAGRLRKTGVSTYGLPETNEEEVVVGKRR